MGTLLHDLRTALRALRRTPGFTAVAVLTLALGIGANSTLFSLVNAVLLRPLPYPGAERIVSVSSTNRGGDRTVADQPSIEYWMEHAHTFEAFAAYQPAGANFSGGAVPERLAGADVTAAFFRVMGVHPALGRAFPEEAAQAGADRTVILGDALWRRAFNADPGILGRVVQLDGVNHTVVGIMPAGFDFPESATFWRPLALPRATGGNPFFYFFALGRLRPGGTLAAAEHELGELRRSAGEALPTSLQEPDVGVRALTLHERLHGDLRPALLVLFATVGCVLLIACANVANLLLARATARRRELAVRAALGASRGRLVRQLLVESLLLALAGGALGLLIPNYALDLFLALAPAELAKVPGIAVDRTVLGFAFALSLLTGLLFGLAPAFAGSRIRLQDALKEGSPAAGGRRGRSRQLLVAGQLALALVLLIGAALFAKSFVTFLGVDSGFRAEGVLRATLSLPRTRYPDEAAWSAFHRTLLERVRALPGVEGATISGVIPLGGYRMMRTVTTKGDGEVEERNIASGNVGAGYFATFGIPLLAGREFNDQDQPGTPPVVVLSESLARLTFPDLTRPGDAVGQVFEWSDQAYTVVGVVGEVRQRPGAVSPLPMAFTSFTQDGASPYATLALRTHTDPRTLIPVLEQVVREIDPEQPLYGIRTMTEELAREVAPRRFHALLLGSFAALALLLAASGLYALIAYLVAQRTREVGIRIALGAERNAVLRLVLREGMMLAAGGIVLGLAGAFALTRLVASLLFRVGTTDPVVFVAVPLVLAAVAALASWVPARRAARVDPMVALRSE